MQSNKKKRQTPRSNSCKCLSRAGRKLQEITLEESIRYASKDPVERLSLIHISEPTRPP